MADSVDSAGTGSGLWQNYVKGSTPTSKEVSGKKENGTLDKDAFLKLLVTQLQYQDPLNPMDDKEFIAQMAQFTSLEQMQNMNANTTKSQAFSLIGKVVIGTVKNVQTGTYEQIAGQVELVSMQNGEPNLIVAGKMMKMEDLEEVYEVQLDSINTNVATGQALSLVGKVVQTVITDSDGIPTDYIEGKVDYIRFDEGFPVLIIGDKPVALSSVLGISDGDILLNKDLDIGAGTGKIQEIKFVNGEPRVVVGGVEAKLKSLAHLIDGYRIVGQTITYGDVTGKVQGLSLSIGAVYLNVETSPGVTKQVKYTDYKGIKVKEDDEA